MTQNRADRRIIKVKRAGRWERTTLAELKKGDVFVFHEFDDERPDGVVPLWRATSDGRPHPMHGGEIEAEEVGQP